MERMLSKVAQSLKPSPIQELSHLAQRSGAINLAEGFPDFPAPSPIKQAAVSAINSDFNQYRSSSSSSYHFFFCWVVSCLSFCYESSGLWSVWMRRKRGSLWTLEGFLSFALYFYATSKRPL